MFDLDLIADNVFLAPGDDSTRYAHAINRVATSDTAASATATMSGCFSAHLVENAIKPGPMDF